MIKIKRNCFCLLFRLHWRCCRAAIRPKGCCPPSMWLWCCARWKTSTFCSLARLICPQRMSHLARPSIVPSERIRQLQFRCTWSYHRRRQSRSGEFSSKYWKVASYRASSRHYPTWFFAGSIDSFSGLRWSLLAPPSCLSLNQNRTCCYCLQTSRQQATAATSGPCAIDRSFWADSNSNLCVWVCSQASSFRKTTQVRTQLAKDCFPSRLCTLCGI